MLKIVPDNREQPVGLLTYEEVGRRYNRTVDAKPMNALYERPNTLALLPDVRGMRILDAGCGGGWYSGQLRERGAHVTSVDISPLMVEEARQRLGPDADVRCMDMAEPLVFGDNEFDLILSALALHYLRDLGPTFREFGRVLKPGGHIVFSMHHPFADWANADSHDYFAVELLEDDWGLGAPIYFYRRSLSDLFKALADGGFMVEQLVEPLPSEEFRRAVPESFKVLSVKPWFLFVRGRKMQ